MHWEGDWPHIRGVSSRILASIRSLGFRRRLHIPLRPLRVARLDPAGGRGGTEVEGVNGQAPQVVRPESGPRREAVAHDEG